MVEWKFNSNEKMHLQGLSVEAKVVYLLEIRTKMDFNTGIAGEGGKKKNIVSYQAWRESLQFIPDACSTRKKTDYSKHKLRAIKDELIRAGLLEQLQAKQHGKMIFKLPFASLGKSDSVYEPHMNRIEEPHSEPHDEPHIVSYKNQEVNEYEPHSEPHNEPHPENPMNRIPQESGNNNINNKYIVRFDEFWNTYDKKLDKSKCQMMYKNILKKNGLDFHDEICEAVRKQWTHREKLKTNGHWVPDKKHPATWLRNKCWSDELVQPEQEMGAYHAGNKKTTVDIRDRLAKARSGKTAV
jgi:hypothetical protein